MTCDGTGSLDCGEWSATSAEKGLVVMADRSGQKKASVFGDVNGFYPSRGQDRSTA